MYAELSASEYKDSAICICIQTKNSLVELSENARQRKADILGLG